MSEETKDTQVDETTDQQEGEVKSERTVETYTKDDLAEHEKKIKRELSKKLNVNLFDEKETESFIKGLESKVDKAEVEKYQQELEEYKPYKEKYQETQFENAILRNNVVEDYKGKVKKLVSVEMQDADDMTYEEAVEKVLTDFPEFSKKHKKGGMDVNTDNSNFSEQEEYIRKNYEKDSSGKLIKKRR